MTSKIYKKWWFWITAILLIIAVFFIFNFDKPTEEEQIKKAIAEASYCETASDCALAGSKCPFGCYIYVNKSEVDRIKSLVEGYESRCIYSCVQSAGVECVDNKCQSKIENPNDRGESS